MSYFPNHAEKTEMLTLELEVESINLKHISSVLMAYALARRKLITDNSTIAAALDSNIAELERIVTELKRVRAGITVSQKPQSVTGAQSHD